METQTLHKIIYIITCNNKWTKPVFDCFLWMGFSQLQAEIE